MAGRVCWPEIDARVDARTGQLTPRSEETPGISHQRVVFCTRGLGPRWVQPRTCRRRSEGRCRNRGGGRSSSLQTEGDGATGVTCRTHCRRNKARPGEPDAVWGIGYCAVQHCRYAARGWDGPAVSDRPPLLGRFLPKLGGAVRRRLSFASAGRRVARPSHGSHEAERERGRPAAVVARGVSGTH